MSHFYDLAKAIRDGENCWYALHDALAEAGCGRASIHQFSDQCCGVGENDTCNCVVVGVILKDPYWMESDTGGELFEEFFKAGILALEDFGGEHPTSKRRIK